MQCSEIERYVDPYLDNEFDARESTEIELHLAKCEGCRRYVELQRALRHTVTVCCKSSAPGSLRDRIVGRLALDVDSTELPCAEPAGAHESEISGANSDESHERATTAAETVGETWRDWTGWRYVSLASAAAVLLGLTALGLTTETNGDSARLLGDLNRAVETPTSDAAPEAVIEETLDWHRRKLPMEVTGPSSDTVRGWFRGKVDFPVRLPAFDDPQVAVLGGRLAKVGDQRAALVTLEVKHRKMSMMVFPEKGLEEHRFISKRPRPRMVMRSASGYNVAILSDGDIAYSFVSDLPKSQLRQIVAGARIR